MNLMSRLAAAGAVAAMGLGLVAAGASAYDLTGGSYTATNTVLGAHVFTAGGYTVFCQSVSFAGDTENGTNAATTQFTPTYGDCDLIGLEVNVVTSGPWELEVTGGTAGGYTGEIRIPATSAVALEIPDLGCEIYVTTPATFAHGGASVLTGVTSASGLAVSANIAGIAVTTNGLCPFGGGDYFEYAGDVNAPGVGVV